MCQVSQFDIAMRAQKYFDSQPYKVAAIFTRVLSVAKVPYKDVLCLPALVYFVCIHMEAPTDLYAFILLDEVCASNQSATTQLDV